MLLPLVSPQRSGQIATGGILLVRPNKQMNTDEQESDRWKERVSVGTQQSEDAWWTSQIAQLSLLGWMCVFP